MATSTSYYVLHVRDRYRADEWWLSAQRAAAEAPPAMRAILAGRTRVELSADEAWGVLRWARSLDGWDPARPLPFLIRPSAPPG